MRQRQEREQRLQETEQEPNQPLLKMPSMLTQAQQEVASSPSQQLPSSQNYAEQMALLQQPQNHQPPQGQDPPRSIGGSFTMASSWQKAPVQKGGWTDWQSLSERQTITGSSSSAHKKSCLNDMGQGFELPSSSSSSSSKPIPFLGNQDEIAQSIEPQSHEASSARRFNSDDAHTTAEESDDRQQNIEPQTHEALSAGHFNSDDTHMAVEDSGDLHMADERFSPNSDYRRMADERFTPNSDDRHMADERFSPDSDDMHLTAEDSHDRHMADERFSPNPDDSYNMHMLDERSSANFDDKHMTAEDCYEVHMPDERNSANFDDDSHMTAEDEEEEEDSDWTDGSDDISTMDGFKGVNDKPSYILSPMKGTNARFDRIAQAKKGVAGRARSGSPAVPQTNLFTTVPQQQQQQQQTNAFSSDSFSYSFGATQNGPSATKGAFSFGVSNATPAFPSAPNGDANHFGQSSASSSFDGSFNAAPLTQQQKNGFNPSNSMIPQPSQQSANTSAFGQSQPNGTSTLSSSFGGFGSPKPASIQNGTNLSFGGTPQEKPLTQSSNPFTSFENKMPERHNLSAPSSSGFGQATQENGFTPSTMLGGSSSTAPHNSGSLFASGQKAKEIEKTSNPFSSFGQNASQGLNKQSTLFSGFNQTPQPSKTPFAGFGAKASENSDTPSTSQNSNPFASFAKNAAGDANKSLFTPSVTNKEAPKLASNALNSKQSTQSSTPKIGLFGAPPPPTESSKGAGSVFDNFPKKDSSMDKFKFDSADPSQVYREEDDQCTQQQTGASNSGIFGSATSSTEQSSEVQAAKNTPLSSFGQSQSTQPKATSSIFGSAQQTSQTKPSSFQQDASMSTSTSAPQKSLFRSSGGQNTNAAGAPPAMATPVAQPRSLFERVDTGDVSKRLGKNLDETPKASFFNSTTVQPMQPFTAKPVSTTPNVFDGGSTTAASTTALGPGSQAESREPQTPKEKFPATAPSTLAIAPTAPATVSEVPPATAPMVRTAAVPSSTAPQALLSANTRNWSDEQKSSLTELNEGFLSHLKTLDPAKDWSGVFRYALIVLAQIGGRENPSDSELNPGPPQPASSGVLARAANPAAPSASASQSSRSVACSSINNVPSQTLKQAPAANPADKPSATATATKKRAFEEDDDDTTRAPSTEKRVKPNQSPQYPKLPETASKTAKLFESTLDRHESIAPSGARNAPKSLFSTSPSTEAPPSAPSIAGFKPIGTSSITSSAPAPGGFRPKLGSSGTGATNFLASFGNLANAAEEKERRKRKAEEYDSDEETPEQWEERDRREQESKRAKIAEVIKNSKGFTLAASPSAGYSAATPTAVGTAKAQESSGDTSTPKTPFLNTPPITSSTPAGATPKFGSLFRPVAPSTTKAGSLAAPTPGFHFGTKPASLDVSRATTPGVTADEEASAASANAPDDEDHEDEDDEQSQLPLDTDMLAPEEREANEILAEIDGVKTQKLAVDEKTGKNVWKAKAFGKIFLLKNKETGKVRVLSKVEATKVVTLNYEPLKGAKYTVHPKKDTMVQAQFYDHLDTKKPGLGTFILTIPHANDAQEIARILTESTPQ